MCVQGEALMSDPKDHRDSDELDLGAETVKDLEPSGDEAEDVRGGATLDCCSVRAVSCIIPK
jgi:hypothetical protein